MKNTALPRPRSKPPDEPAWHLLDAGEVLRRLGLDPAQGLDAAQAARRLARDGPNALAERGAKTSWSILREQLESSMVVLLALAAALSALLRDFIDAAVITAILILNALLGFFQEYKAEKTMAALKKIAVSRVKVRRSGRIALLSAPELVRGDVVLLEAGSRIAADCRLLQAESLDIDESCLTGEALPARKDPGALSDAYSPLGDRRNMAYLGTTVASGRGLGVVVETAMRTELGKIAGALETIAPQPTPMQRRLEQWGRSMALAALAVVLLFFILGLLRGEPLRLMFLTAVSMAVAAVPEGLPAVVTVTLALAAQRMFKRRALIRKLTAVETLGSVTTICTDKTGTLTENRMTVAAVDVFENRLEFAETLRRNPEVLLLLAAQAACSDAFLEPEPDASGRFKSVGSPTEGALVAAAAVLGLRKPALDRAFPRIAELPFDSGRKRMATRHRLAWPQAGELPADLRDILEPSRNTRVVFVKGSVESLLGICARVRTSGGTAPLDDALRERILKAEDQLAYGGLRVLGAAYAATSGGGDDEELLERDLTFIGMTGMDDPLREQARGAVAACRTAGIRPIMITGDHPRMAERVARNLGMDGQGRVLAGRELAALSDAELEEAIDGISVFARVSPQQKLKIVSALKNRGHVVAMTGDGVNDAPALKKADIGVAMGVAGTDVAKEAAAMILLDDSFATIVAAIKEGRVVYDNIRKFIKYLMTTNSGELWVMLLAPLLGMPLPLTPLQILWINLITDGLPALALGHEPPEPGVMSRPPRDPREGLLSGGMGPHILWVGLLMALLSLGAGLVFWSQGRPSWQTMLLMTMTFAQMAHVLAIRSETESSFRIGWSGNPVLGAAVLLTTALQLAIIYLPGLRTAFATTPLSAGELGLALALGAVVFAAVELEKWIFRCYRPKHDTLP